VIATNGRRDQAGDMAWRQQLMSNVRGTLMTLFRAPRHEVRWPSRQTIVLGAVAAVAAVIVTMLLFDATAVAAARRLPIGLVHAFRRLTDLGLSGWFLWPLGLMLIALAFLDSPSMPLFLRHVLAAWAVRLGFLFTAIGLPSLFVSIVKRLIGRGRPFVDGDGVWSYAPFIWRADHASLPSGHATTAFSALVAIGALYPAARPLLWIYAIAIALSRVVVTAHFPSDVLAGAIIGATGAYLVRDWFAARRLGFAVGTDGAVRPRPGPSVWRIIKAIARRLHSA
jgi:membrane-associated phospholipid phosphatase